MALRREEPWEQGEREAEEMRREELKEREARFLPSEFQMWTYFTPEEETTIEERQEP